MRTLQPPSARGCVDGAWADAPVDVLVNSGRGVSGDPVPLPGRRHLGRGRQSEHPGSGPCHRSLANRVIEAGRAANVVNISSGAALRARPGAAPYSTSKAALEMVTRASALRTRAAGHPWATSASSRPAS